MTEAIRIAVLNFVHETVTFLPNDTALDDFIHDGSPARGEALLAWEPRSYMGGFVKVAREHAGVELVGIESPLWPRTGTGSGWIAYSDHRDHSVRAIVITCSDHRDRSSERNDARVIVSSLESPRKWIVDQGRPGGYQGSAPLGERGL